MNIFLGGAFESYGREFLHYFEPETADEAAKGDHADPSDMVFPKVRMGRRFPTASMTSSAA